MKLSPESIEKLRASLKKKWASGTRKPNPPEMYERTSALMKEKYATGEMTYRPSYEISMKGLAARDMEKVRAQCSINGKLKLGKPNPPGLSEAGPANIFAKEWAVRSPLGVVLRGRNLNHLIRQNAAMFAQRDVVWVKGMCRASKGLGQLFLTKSDGKTPCAYSWRGWTPILKAEVTEPTPHHLGRIVTLSPTKSIVEPAGDYV